MKNIAFFMGIYKEQLSARTRIFRLKTLYSQSIIFCISDGIEDPLFESFCSEQGVFYFLGDRLKIKGLGGQWSQRYMQTFLDITPESVDTLIKIDPGDTGIHRRFNYLPPPEVDLFGTLYGGKRPNICGGCMGYRRKGVQRIIESGLLSATELSSYRRFQPPYQKPGEATEDTQVTFQDEIVFKVAIQLNLRVEAFADVHASMRRGRPDAENRFALSHPYFYPGEPGYLPDHES